MPYQKPPSWSSYGSFRPDPQQIANTRLCATQWGVGHKKLGDDLFQLADRMEERRGEHRRVYGEHFEDEVMTGSDDRMVDEESGDEVDENSEPRMEMAQPFKLERGFKELEDEEFVMVKPKKKPFGRMTNYQALIRLLEKREGPITTRKAGKILQEWGYIGGKTPWGTVSALVTNDMQRFGDNSRTRRCGRGLICLR